MTSIANVLKTQFYTDWGLSDAHAKTAIAWYITKADENTRFKLGTIAIEMYTSTAPVSKKSISRSTTTHLVIVDIWLKPTPWDDATLGNYDTDLDSLTDEVARIVKLRQKTFSGLRFTHVLNRGINLDEPENRIMRRQMLLSAKEETE